MTAFKNWLDTLSKLRLIVKFQKFVKEIRFKVCAVVLAVEQRFIDKVGSLPIVVGKRNLWSDIHLVYLVNPTSRKSSNRFARVGRWVVGGDAFHNLGGQHVLGSDSKGECYTFAKSSRTQPFNWSSSNCQCRLPLQAKIAMSMSHSSTFDWKMCVTITKRSLVWNTNLTCVAISRFVALSVRSMKQS